jgi:hypothetical protein
VKAGDAAGSPAIEEGRAERNEPAGAGIGVKFEGVTEEDAAHAMANGVEGFAGGEANEGTEAAEIFLQAMDHGVVMELMDQIAEAAKAAPKEDHLPTVDDGTVHENDGGRISGRMRHILTYAEDVNAAC